MEEKEVKAEEETEVKKPAVKRRGRPKKEEAVEEVKEDKVDQEVEPDKVEEEEISQEVEDKTETEELKEEMLEEDKKEDEPVEEKDESEPIDEVTDLIELTELTPIFKTQLIDEPEMGVLGLARILDECEGCERKYIEIMNPGFGLIRGYINK